MILIPYFKGASEPSQIEGYLNQLILQLNYVLNGSQGIPGAMFDLTTSAGSATLPPVSGTMYIRNSTAALLLAPAPAVEGLTYDIYDAGGTAGTYPISFQATVAGVTNPVILDVSYATARLQYHNGNWDRIR